MAAGLAQLLKPVTHPALSYQVFGLIGIVFYFFAQRAYEYPEVLGLFLIGYSPNGFEYVLMGKHPANIGSQQGQELVFCGCKFEQLVVLSHRSGRKIDEQIA